MHQNTICAKYAATTVLYASFDESDLNTGSISQEVVKENNNIIHNNNKFLIGIDDEDEDEDDDNNSESNVI